MKSQLSLSSRSPGSNALENGDEVPQTLSHLDIHYVESNNNKDNAKGSSREILQPGNINGGEAKLRLIRTISAGMSLENSADVAAVLMTDLGHDEEEDDDDQIEELKKDTTSYTIFVRGELWLICITAASFAFFSTISSPIYVPAIPVFKDHFHVSTELINLTIVVYSIFQGLTPGIFASIADIFGRRPVVAICYIIYIIADIGLAVTNVYWLLFVLRCVQAAGIASSVSIGAGIVGDITTRSNRGSYMGVFSGFSVMGNAFGPLIGGALTESLGWRAIFWFLAIASGCFFISSMCLLPETKRSIVGNGSIKPKNWWSKAPIMYLPRFSDRTSFNKSINNNVIDNSSLEPPKNLNILMPFLLCKNIPVLLTLTPVSLHYSAWFMMITASSTLLDENYGFNTLKIGLCFLATGLGSLTGSITTGPLLDWYYKRCKTKYADEVNEYQQLSISDRQNSDIEKPYFNIYKARLNLCIIPSAFVFAAQILFGWTIEYSICVALPLIGSFVVAFGNSYYIAMTTTLLVDLYPWASSSASATLNIFRCLLAAVGLAVVDRMCKSLGAGGAFTLLGGMCFFSNALIYWEVWRAPKWELQRRKKQQLEKLEKIEKDENSHGQNNQETENRAT